MDETYRLMHEGKGLRPLLREKHTQSRLGTEQSNKNTLALGSMEEEMR